MRPARFDDNSCVRVAARTDGRGWTGAPRRIDTPGELECASDQDGRVHAHNLEQKPHHKPEDDDAALKERWSAGAKSSKQNRYVIQGAETVTELIASLDTRSR